MSTTTTPTAGGYVELTEAERAAIVEHAKVCSYSFGEAVDCVDLKLDEFDRLMVGAQVMLTLWKAARTGVLTPTEEARDWLRAMRAELTEAVEDDRYRLQREPDPQDEHPEKIHAGELWHLNEDLARLAACESVLNRLPSHHEIGRLETELDIHADDDLDLVTVEVPARTIDRLRDEVYCCLGGAGEALDHAGFGHDAYRVEEMAVLISQGVALLDVIGWDIVKYENDFKLPADDTVEIPVGRAIAKEVADYVGGGARDDLRGVSGPLHPDDRAAAEMKLDLATRFLLAVDGSTGGPEPGPLTGEHVMGQIGELLSDLLHRVPADDPYRGALEALDCAANFGNRA